MTSTITQMRPNGRGEGGGAGGKEQETLGSRVQSREGKGGDRSGRERRGREERWPLTSSPRSASASKLIITSVPTEELLTERKKALRK